MWLTRKKGDSYENKVASMGATPIETAKLELKISYLREDLDGAISQLRREVDAIHRALCNLAKQVMSDKCTVSTAFMTIEDIEKCKEKDK